MSRIITSTLTASTLTASIAAAQGPVIVSPGVTLIGTGGNGPMSGFSMGFENTVNVITDLDDEPSFGGLLQFEFDFDGNYRLNFGGQTFGLGFGVEVAYSITFGEAPTTHGAMINPFIGFGLVNAALRNHFSPEGHEMGGALSLKMPLYDGEPVFISLLRPQATAGRPLRAADGRLRRPQVVVIGRHPSPADLPAESRAALGRAWLEDARDEHAAVEAFRRLARQLAARGAPRGLVRRALRSARDEVRHARGCLAVAERLLGLRLALVLPPGDDGPLPDLPTLARESREDGVINEGAAAGIAARGARCATIEPVRRLQAAIADEEAGHAALAAGVERWAAAEGGAPVRAALAHAPAVDPGAVDLGAAAPHGDDELWRRWGRVDLGERRDAWATAARA